MSHNWFRVDEYANLWRCSLCGAGVRTEKKGGPPPDRPVVVSPTDDEVEGYAFSCEEHVIWQIHES